VLKEELVTDVNVMNETRQDPGALFVLCELRDGVEPAVVEAAVREEIAAQIEEGVAKKDLQRIRAQIRASFLFQDESVLDLAMKLGRFEAGTPDGYRTLATVLPTYESLSSDELRAVAARYLDFERAAVVWALPGARDKADGVGANKAKVGKRKARLAAIAKVSPVAVAVPSGRKTKKNAAKAPVAAKASQKKKSKAKGNSKQRGKRA
jgi:hypothetical protein